MQIDRRLKDSDDGVFFEMSSVTAGEHGVSSRTIDIFGPPW